MDLSFTTWINVFWYSFGIFFFLLQDQQLIHWLDCISTWLTLFLLFFLSIGNLKTKLLWWWQIRIHCIAIKFSLRRQMKGAESFSILKNVGGRCRPIWRTKIIFRKKNLSRGIFQLDTLIVLQQMDHRQIPLEKKPNLFRIAPFSEHNKWSINKMVWPVFIIFLSVAWESNPAFIRN